MKNSQQSRPHSARETTAQRSRTMRAVKSVNTAPELAVRGLITSLGYRYRLHRKDLPGKPDLAFMSLRKAIFVHGCFWHGHSCARGARVPKSNANYWTGKISRNRTRGRRQQRQLNSMGWKTMVIWECSLANEEKVTKKISRFLAMPSAE